MTLTELANGLRKIFDFNYITVHARINFSVVTLWKSKDRPYFYPNEWNTLYCDDFVGAFDLNCLTKNLDLSEYADESGKVDYSRCMVDLSEHKED